LILLGFAQQPSQDTDRLHTLLSRPQIRADLVRVGVADSSDLAALYLFGGQRVEHLASKGSANTDDNAHIELVGPFHYYQLGQEANRAKIDQQFLGYAAQELATGNHLIREFKNVDPHAMMLDVGRFYLDHNQGPWAMVFINESLKLRETARGHYLKGRVLSSLSSYMATARPDAKGNAEQIMGYAVQEFEKSAKLDPSSESAQLSRFELGAAYYKKGLTHQAVEQYEAILQVDPVSYEANANIGALYLQNGNLKEALKAYQRALKTHAQDPEVYFKLGLIYSRLSQYQPAIDAYEEALKLSPAYLDAHFNLARVYELTQQPQKALQHYSRFLELAPPAKDFDVQRKVVEVKLHELERNGIR
jgi:tetratricopeptide (TPR) repeat protein